MAIMVSDKTRTIFSEKLVAILRQSKQPKQTLILAYGYIVSDPGFVSTLNEWLRPSQDRHIIIVVGIHRAHGDAGGLIEGDVPTFLDSSYETVKNRLIGLIRQLRPHRANREFVAVTAVHNFHAKFFALFEDDLRFEKFLGESLKPEDKFPVSQMILGSSNLTPSALSGNLEMDIYLDKDSCRLNQANRALADLFTRVDDSYASNPLSEKCTDEIKEVVYKETERLLNKINWEEDKAMDQARRDSDSDQEIGKLD